MPLKKSASKGALKQNIRAEIKVGRPVKEAAAIAYSLQRQAKKKRK